MDLIKEKGLTTKEIKQALGTELNISPVVNLMCDRCLLIRGIPKKGWKSNIHTYYRFDEYFPDIALNVKDETKAREIIVGKYIAAFGPVTLNDIVWWTGFPKGQINKILDRFQDNLCHVEITDNEKDFLMLSTDLSRISIVSLPTKPIMNLLPSLDPYLMGYKDRERYLDLQNYNMIFDRSGNATNSILLDGRIIGVWDLIEPFVKIFLFNNVNEKIMNEIHSKAKKIGEFISGNKIKIKECNSMIPLTQRTAGSVMSPLKFS
jgi:hypothetical protein